MDNQYKPWWDRHDDARFPRTSHLPVDYFTNPRPTLGWALYAVAVIIGVSLFLAWSATL